MQPGHAGRIIEGIVLEVGWYRTVMRSFEREIFTVPNSVFSRTVILNVSRKGKEWRIFERIGLRLSDVLRAPLIVDDMRAWLKAVRSSRDLQLRV